MNIKEQKNISKAWQNGFTYAPKLEGEKGVGYVLKYISKERIKIENCEPEFSLTSKGIGSNYLTPQMIKYHTQNVENCYITLKGGYKIPIPKYYKEKIYNDNSKIKRGQITKYLDKRKEIQETERLSIEERNKLHKTKEQIQRNMDLWKSGTRIEERFEKL